jgi:hypothetical protein
MKLSTLALFLSTTLLVHAAPFFAPPGWKLGTEFPSTPRLSPAQTAGEVVQTGAVCEDSTGFYIALCARYPVDIPKANLASIYDSGRDAMLSSMSADLVKEEKITIAGHEGRRYVIKGKGQSQQADSRFVVIGNEVYSFMFATSKEPLNPPAAAAFLGKIRAAKKS